jgi:hypothetical protein
MPERENERHDNGLEKIIYQTVDASFQEQLLGNYGRREFKQQRKFTWPAQPTLQI